MKKTVILTLTLFALMACKKEKIDPIQSQPQHELVGSWIGGSLYEWNEGTSSYEYLEPYLTSLQIISNDSLVLTYFDGTTARCGWNTIDPSTVNPQPEDYVVEFTQNGLVQDRWMIRVFEIGGITYSEWNKCCFPTMNWIVNHKMKFTKQ